MAFLRTIADGWIDLLASVHPHAALTWAGAEGRLARRVGRSGPTATEVARFFSLDGRAAREVAGEIASTGARSRVLRRLAGRRGLGATGSLVRVRGAEHLAGLLAATSPALLVVAPQGPRIAAVAALQQMGTTALLVANVPRQPYADWGLEVCTPGSQPGHGGAIALKAAVDRLRAGGCVIAALEGEVGRATLKLGFLGGTLALRPGIAVMARLGRAPVIPLTAAWVNGDRPIEIRVHPPLYADSAARDTDQSDRDLLTAVAQRVEGLMRADPGQCDLKFLRTSLGFPPHGSAAGNRPET